VPDNTDSSGIPLLGPIIDALTEIFSNKSRVEDLASSVDQVEQNTWSNALNVAGWTFGLFGGVLSSLGALVKGIGRALEHLVRDIIFGHLLRLIQAIRDLLKRLHDAIAPLIKWLEQLQKIQRQYQLQTLKRVVGLIQRVRTVLRVFKLFHLKFATKLDAWLAGIEGKLIHGTFELARKTNEILGWVDVIADPLGFHNSKWLFGSIARDLAAITAATRAIGLKQMFPKQLNQTWTDAPPSPRGPVIQIGV
jgi:hypothetical protein